MARYFAPYTPVAFVLLWSGFTALLGKVLRGRGLVCAQVVLLLAIVSHGVGSVYAFKVKQDPQTYPGFVMRSENLVAPALWMRDHLPQDAVIATRRIGALGYYSEKSILDYRFGLTDRHVARLIAEHGRQFDDPGDEALGDVWRRVEPDFILDDMGNIQTIASRSTNDPTEFLVHGYLYRLLKKFRIGRDTEWVLTKRIE